MTHGLDEEIWAELESCTFRNYKSKPLCDEYQRNLLLLELVRLEMAEVVLLKHDNIRETWNAMVANARTTIETRRKKKRILELKRSGALKLSAEERRLFKIPDPESIDPESVR